MKKIKSFEKIDSSLINENNLLRLRCEELSQELTKQRQRAEALVDQLREEKEKQEMDTRLSNLKINQLTVERDDFKHALFTLIEKIPG